MNRPTLVPGIAALWRGPRTLQLGLDPARALVLDLPNPSVAGLLDLLDGERTEPTVIAAAGRRGIPEPDARALLETLHRHRFVLPAPSMLPATLLPAERTRLVAEASALAQRELGRAAPRQPGTMAIHLPPPGASHPTSAHAIDCETPDQTTPAGILRRRNAARVRLTGPGRLGVPIALALASAGIGHVDPALDGTAAPGEPLCPSVADGPPRSRAMCAGQAIATFAPGTRMSALPRRDSASFLVHVGPLPAPAALYSLTMRRVAHLAVTVRDGTPVIGPLVSPGVSPCLNCVDLHKTDRDPAWPRLAAQLATPDGPLLREYTEICGITTALAGAAYAVDEVLRYLDGGSPRTLGATVEVAIPGEARRRSWPPHPRCGCATQQRSRRSMATRRS